jgi:hypothetical protein
MEGRETKMIPKFGAAALSCAMSTRRPQAFVTFNFGRSQESIMHRAICFSHAEVTSITPLGFWLQFGEEELYLPFVEFPWFEHATVAQICRIECPGAARLYWPALDLDFSIDTIRNPLAFSHCGSGDSC